MTAVRSDLEVRVDALERAVSGLKSGVAVMVCAPDEERVAAALSVAVGAAAMHERVEMFFAFAATSVLRRGAPPTRREGAARAGMPDREELMRMAAETGVRISVCQASLEMLGLRVEDLVDYPDLKTCGVGTFLEIARGSHTTLFV